MRKKAVWSLLSFLCILPLLLSSCGNPSQTSVCYAMGSRVVATAYSGTLPYDVASRVTSLENSISRKIPSSLISQVNAGEALCLPEELATVLSVCQNLTERTAGAFDLSVGAFTSLWDFDGTPSVPSEATLNAAHGACGWSSHVLLDGKMLTVQNATLDLGAIGKGMACDTLIALFRERGCSGVVSVGGSVGTLSENGKVYTIAIRDPFGEENGYLGTIKMENGFISTSGTYEKYIEKDGVRYHHILDARTGMPMNNGLVSVTVKADTGFLSDALSTAAFLLGAEEGMALCREYGACAVFVTEEGTLLVSEALREVVSFREGLQVEYR